MSNATWTPPNLESESLVVVAGEESEEKGEQTPDHNGWKVVSEHKTPFQERQ